MVVPFVHPLSIHLPIILHTLIPGMNRRIKSLGKVGEWAGIIPESPRFGKTG
jgi:hypothetical protein